MQSYSKDVSASAAQEWQNELLMRSKTTIPYRNETKKETPQELGLERAPIEAEEDTSM